MDDPVVVLLRLVGGEFWGLGEALGELRARSDSADAG